MAPAKKQPSNSDILKEVKDINAMQKQQAISISNLEQWKIAEDAYRAALKQVKNDDEQDKYAKLRDGELKKRTEVLKQIGIIAGIIIAILYAYAATHGIKT